MSSEINIGVSCALPHTATDVVRLGHGSGGKMTANLIESIFLPTIGNDVLAEAEDAAVLPISLGNIALTTDSYVVSPLFFSGGDIGSLSVHGTVNDLSMRGARPLAMTASFILEEGFPLADLKTILTSMQKACCDSNIQLVAADTKVVGRGAADKLFITTTGIGLVSHLPAPSVKRAKVGDVVILSGDIGRHGIVVMAARQELDLETTITSDSAPLDKVIQMLLASGSSIHCLRDVTRGGLAGVLNEIARASGVGVAIDEASVPVHPEVKAFCELLGFDPLYVACEGRFVLIAEQESAEKLISIMKEHAPSKDAHIIGRIVCDHPKRVVMRSLVGGHRIVDMLSGEQLPRIC